MPNPTDETTRKTVGILLSEAEWRRIEDFAARERRSLSNAASLLLAAALAAEPAPTRRAA